MRTINMGEIEKIHQGIPELPGKGEVCDGGPVLNV